MSMKKLILIAFLIIVIGNVVAQKNSLTVKTGHTNSDIDLPISKPHNFAEIGIGYTFKLSNLFWISTEPGIKTAGYITNKRNASVYLNSPIIGTFNIGKNRIIAAMDFGYNPNYKIIAGSTPNFSELLFGARAGYRISDKISIEIYYRYGESLKSFAFDKNLTTNYIAIQTRVSLGYSKPAYQP